MQSFGGGMPLPLPDEQQEEPAVKDNHHAAVNVNNHKVNESSIDRVRGEQRIAEFTSSQVPRSNAAQALIHEEESKIPGAATKEKNTSSHQSLSLNVKKAALA